MLIPRTRAASLCLAAMLALPGAAAAQTGEAGESGQNAPKAANPVVAVVDGKEIRYKDVLDSVKQLPQQYQQQFTRLFPMLLDRVVDMHILNQRAAEAGLADDPEVKERVAEARKRIMSQILLERRRDDFITEERLRQAYEDYLEKNKPAPEVKARHILVDEESKAKDLIAQLEGGADFVALAEEHSTGPSGQNGGDLGYFTQDQMVAPFAEAAFALDAGEFTNEPVKTQFGWHVIKVDDRRTKEPKSFEEMEPQLRQQLANQATQQVLAEMREGVEVKTYPERAPGVETDGEETGGKDGQDSGGEN